MATNHDTEFQRDIERAQEFFTHLSPALIQPSLDIAREIGESRFVRDEIYRVFHRSFKMYRFSVHVYTMVAAMLAPLGFNPADKEEDQNLHDLIKALEYWRFDQVFINFVRLALFTKFDMVRQADNWQKDAQALVGGFFMAKEVCISSLISMHRMSAGEGFLWNPGVLSHEDALFLEVWEPLGMAFRYGYNRQGAEVLTQFAKTKLKPASNEVMQ